MNDSVCEERDEDDKAEALEGLDKIGENAIWGNMGEGGFYPISEANEQLPPGYYEYAEYPDRLTPKEMKQEELYNFPDSKCEKVLQEIKTFWGQEKLYEALKIPYKRGILLYGPPGAGKSCTLEMACKMTMTLGGVILCFKHIHQFEVCYKMVRKVQPTAPVVAIIEDLDGTVQDVYAQEQLLSMMDGITQIHKVVFIGTTNNLKEIPSRVLRPSRFDKIIEIDLPKEPTRRFYLENMLKKLASDKVDLNKWAHDTEGLSVAHLKELFIAVVVSGQNYEDTLTRLRT